ncbi:cellobiose phosphorylase [Clostridium sp. 19966]|uniref:GH36-type glycosyl hydrolase domain-containing protein n=1 Tax=Clostridium sp. 19966 TaxID=2768166 RepID=UPI0028E01B81|nr:amylo-alpha-1,6-glucosidase [Clostridium sp. 19966]MDT8718040.1 cellobiose phosphorylase [Clostridium sp. 19966]
MNKINCFVDIKQDKMLYRFLPSGDIFTFTYDKFLVNQFRGNVKDGSANNIYLRIYDENNVRAYPLLGIKSKSSLSTASDSLVYEGSIEGISYKVTFRPVNHIWFWDITLKGSNKKVDLVYGQDIGISEENGVYTNELYTAEYLGHSVFEGENGYVICSRQNMPSSDCFPYIQQGVIGAKAVHYSTDGLQFFGLSYKETNTPEILTSDLLDYNLQYEFSYTALQTEKLNLDGGYSLAFYGLFLSTHEEAVKELEFKSEIEEAYSAVHKNLVDAKLASPINVKKKFSEPFSSLAFTEDEINALYPERILEETKDGKLLSFFTDEHAHIVTKDKELLTERPHGTIIITPPSTDSVDNQLISSTQYMYGIFNSHVVTGNTDLHKLISTPRGFLNVMKNSGQRIYLGINGQYHLLNLPGLFEMGMNYSKWHYKLEDDFITITAYTAADRSDLILEVSSKNNKKYDYIITNQLVMGNNEYTKDITYTEIKDGLSFALDTEKYPGLRYELTIPGQSFTLSDDRIFFEEEKSFDETLLTISLKDNSDFQLIIKAYLTEAAISHDASYTLAEEKKKAYAFYQNLINDFHLDIENSANKERIQILNQTIWWYAHNAMIHFSMPHGLEQPGGAAWGTRDVCQGPMELFLATQNYTIMRSMLLNIFAHQNIETKEWPQWFMFDKYPMNAGECHGDVIFWPLKSVADYILASGDKEILNELLPYDGAPGKKETVLQHICYALSNIKETRIIKGTGLITYAGGDWDDTLQPASEELKTKLVSSWTVALAYQTFNVLCEALSDINSELSSEFASLAALVKKSFHEILIKDDVVAGFLKCDDTYDYMLHPADDSTGIHYRLLPMTRSIIAELVDQDQARKNVTTIQSTLKCPDGVRLMDCPAHYDGGVSHLFKRAEQAANVGREISLQYTHAHIRYIEAMAKFGSGEEAWNSLFTINPILIQHSVNNANIRQSNLYFSSSDGAFNDRYEYEKNFGLLRTGDIKVKGGWRLYSSGPGIYIRQLVSNVLGVRFSKEGLIIDPVLPAELDGLEFTYQCFGRKLHLKFQIKEENISKAYDNKNEIPSTPLVNPYRNSGIIIAKEELTKCGDHLTIYAKAF